MQQNRFKNYGLWVSIASLIPLLLSSFGIEVMPNYQEIINMILGILVTAGIVSNPTTKSTWYKDDRNDGLPPEQETNLTE